jgi:hypothetical protein
MRRLALSMLVISTTALSSGCRDFTSSGDPLPEIQGSLDADVAVPAEGATNLVAEGWQVSIRFVQNLFVIVRLPPGDAFEPPELDFGRFTTGPGQVMSFYDEDDELVETADYEVTGSESNVLLLDFERGSLGFAHMRAAVGDPVDFSGLDGIFEATEFVLEDGEGTQIDLAQEEGAEVGMSFHPFNASYSLGIAAPAGVLADTAVSLETGVHQFMMVGTSMILEDLMGCEPMFATKPTLTDHIGFHGYACDIAGKPYLVRARFERR